MSSMKLVRSCVAGAVVASVAVVMTPASPVVQAAGILESNKDAPTTTLAGDPISYTLEASNSGDEPLFNVSYRDVLPLGVTYAGPTDPASAGEPKIVTNVVENPLGSGDFVEQQTLIWQNVADIQPADSTSISFAVEVNGPDDPVEPGLPVYLPGSMVMNTAEAYASTNARRLPGFDPDTGEPIPDPDVDVAPMPARVTTLTAIEIDKDEPSPEGELLRGVHNHTTIYTLTVRATEQGSSNGVVVTDYLPASLEFLGCGGTDNGSGGPEYPGAPLLSASAPVAGCVEPDSVETVVDPPPDGLTVYPAGTYTKVTWNLGVLAADETVTLPYRAGVPLNQNALFPDPPPDPTTGEQGSNLDNNTGPSTRELDSESSVTNIARVGGTYTGAVEPGTDPDVESDATVTRSIEDIRIRKSVVPTQFATGGTATYAIVIDTSEYVTGSGIVLADDSPNGICPLGPEVYTTDDPGGECPALGSGSPDLPSVPFDTVTEDTTDGGFDIVFEPIASLGNSSTTSVTYRGRMRQEYHFGVLDGRQVASGDTLVNTVSLQDATTTPIPESPEIGDQTVTDTSQAEQTTTGLTLDKRILPRELLPAGACPTDDGLYTEVPAPISAEYQFRLGDRVCFVLNVDFSGTVYTRNPAIADFLPVGVEYVAGSMVAADGNTVELNVPGDGFNEAEAAAGSENPTWFPGAGTIGDRFTDLGDVFQVVLAGRVVDIPDGDDPEVRGNLMKMRTENNDGNATSYRDELPFEIVPSPPVEIVKGVAEIDDPAFSAAGPDEDDQRVVEGSVVTYRLDISNPTPDDEPNGFSVRGLDVWDVLPAGIDCGDVDNIDNFIDGDSGDPQYGVCTDPGDAGHPSFVGSGDQSAIRWVFPTIPGDVDRYAIDSGETRTLTYDVTIPTPTGAGVTLDNTAHIRAFDAFTNELNVGAQYFPRNNVDTTVDPSDENAPAASDPSSVFTEEPVVGKTGTTSIEFIPGNNTPNQAVPGELITYTYWVDIPANTSVVDGVLSDQIPTGRIELVAPAPSGSFYPDASTAPAGALPLPAGFVVDDDGTLTFPDEYTNDTDLIQRFEVVATAQVRNNFNQLNRNINNTAGFDSIDPVTLVPILIDDASYRVRARQPNPSLEKQSDAPLGFVGAGTLVTYTLTARNANGRPPLEDSWIVDCLPDGLTFEAYLPPADGSNTLPPVAGDDSNGCPTGTTRLAFDIGTIRGNNNADAFAVERQYTARVSTDAAGGTAYRNDATLTGSSLDDGKADPTAPDNPVEGTYSAEAFDEVTVPGAGLTKTVDPEVAAIGETVEYTVSVSVPRDTNFYRAAIRDLIPVGLDVDSLAVTDVRCFTIPDQDGDPSTDDCSFTATPLTPVAVGDDTLIAFLFGDVVAEPYLRTIVVRYTARIDDVPSNVAGAPVTNAVQAVWNADDTGSVPTAADYPWTNEGAITPSATVEVLEPDVSIVKLVSNPTPEPTELFTYALRLENAAGEFVGAAYDGTVVDTVPEGVVVIEASITNNGQYDPTTREITWLPADLPGPIAPGGTVELNYSARLDASSGLDGTPLVNTADIVSYTSFPTDARTYDGPDDDAVVAPQFPELSMAKRIVDGPPSYIDEEATWEIVVTNDGGGTAFAVGVTDTLPPNWSYVADSSAVLDPAGDAIDPAPQPIVLPGPPVRLSWPALGQLDPNESFTITFRATPGPGVVADPGVGSTVDHTNNTASAAADRSGALGNADGLYTAATSADTRIDAVDLLLVKDHGAEPVAGAEFDWTITVSNPAGNDTAVGPFTVTDPLATTPAGVDFVSATGPGWTCAEASGLVTCDRTNAADTLAPGASFPPITITVLPPADLADGTELTNTAAVTSRTYELNPDDNTDDDTATVTTSADLAIDKQLLGGELVAGTQATYLLDVDNLGPSVSLGPIEVVDTLPGGVEFVTADGGASWSCDHDDAATGGDVTCTRAADLAVGSAPTIEITVFVPTAASGSFVNTAVVNPGPTPDPDLDNNDDDVSVGVDAEADLELTKTALGPFVAGEPTVYRLRVENLGPSDAAEIVTITDTLPAGLTYASFASVAGTWDCTPDSPAATAFTCELDGPLVDGGVATVDITVDVAADVLGDVTNTGSVESPTPDPDTDNNDDDAPATFVGSADLAIAKSSGGTATPGETLTWTLQVDNLGPSDAQGPITVTDTLPPGLVAPVLASGTDWACTPVASTVTCTRATSLAAGDSAPPITLEAVVDAAAGPSTLPNTASVSSPTDDPNTANNTDDDTVTIIEPSVVLAKSVDDTTPEPGDRFTYTLALTNAAGPTIGAAYNLVVTDVVPDGVEVDTGTISSGGTYDGPSRTITWDDADLPGPLAPGDTLDLTYEAELAASITIDRTPLTNTAVLDSYESFSSNGRTYVGNSSTATVTPRFPQLAATKTVPDGELTYIGDEFAWQIVVTNAGDGAAADVSITDTLPTNWSYVAGSTVVVAPGATTTPDPTIAGNVATWASLGSLDAGASLTINFLTMPGPDVATDPGVGSTVDQVNRAVADATDATGADTNAEGPYASPETSAVARIDAADLIIDKSSTGSPVAGTDFSWTVVVSNASGVDTAVGPFTVTDTLPAGLTFVSATGTGWACSGAGVDVSCSRTSGADTLAPGAAFEPITVTASVPSDLEGTIVNTASVTGRTFELNPDDNTDTDEVDVVGEADLGIVKNRTGSLLAGTAVTYTLDVTNLGPSTSSATIVVTDTLPAETEFVSATGVDWSCTHDGAATGGVITCDYAFDVPLGGVAPQITVTADVLSSTTGDVTNTSSVTGPTTDPNPTNNDDDDTGTVVTSADLAIEKRATGELVAGQPATYELRVENFGPSDALDVQITDTLPPELSYTSFTSVVGDWTCVNTGQLVTCDLTGALAAGDGATVNVVVLVDPSVGDGDVIVNTAAVGSSTPDPNLANNDDSDSSEFDAVADLAVTKTSSGPATAGEPATWSIEVVNNGPSDAQGPITVVDTLPTGVTFVSADGDPEWSCSHAAGTVTCDREDALAAGVTATTIELVVDVAEDAGPSVLTNFVTVDGPTTDSDLSNNADRDRLIVGDAAELSIVKTTTGANPVIAGEATEFEVVVTNEGPSTADAVVVTDTLPAGLTVVSATGSGWTCTTPSSTAITCERPTLPVGEAPPISVGALSAAAVPDGTTLQNMAVVDSSTPGDDPGDNTATADVVVNAEADLAVTKTHAVDPVVAGETVVFELTVSNLGPSDDPGPVTIVDTLPAGFVYVSSTGSWTCTPGPIVPAGQQTVECDLDVVPLLAGATAPALAMRVQVDPATDTGAYVNSATVSSPTVDPNDVNDTADDTVNISTRADLSIVKTHPVDSVRIGSELVFEVVVSNAGPSEARDVQVTDTVPAGLTFVSATGAGWTCTDAACTLDEPLAPGASTAPIAITVVVEPEAFPGVDNIVDTSTSTPEPNLDDNRAIDTVIVPPLVDLTIDKTIDGDAIVGENATFVLTVGNLGPIDESAALVVTDELPDELVLVSARSDGAACTTDANTVTCTRAEGLSVGDSFDVVIDAEVLAEAYPEFANTATVESVTDDVDPTNNTSTVVGTVPPLVDLAIEKRHIGSLAVGEGAEYRIEVVNLGPTDDPGPVTMTDTFPTGLLPTSFDAEGASCELDRRTVSCTWADGLTVGETVEVVVTADVEPSAYPSVTNTAEVTTPSAETDLANNVATDVASVEPLVLLSIVKTLAGQTDDVATWTLLVGNDGPNATVEPIVIIDDLPAGLTFSSVSGNGWDCANVSNRVTCTYDDTLVAGATAPPVTLVTTVSGTPGSTVVNVAAVGGGGPNTPPVTDNATAVVPKDTPATGSDPFSTARWAPILIAAGVLMVLAARRRRASATTTS